MNSIEQFVRTLDKPQKDELLKLMEMEVLDEYRYEVFVATLDTAQQDVLSEMLGEIIQQVTEGG